MRWSERQLAMLREMGIRVWAPAGVPAATSAEAEAVSGSATLVAERAPVPTDRQATTAVARAPAAAYEAVVDRPLAAPPPALSVAWQGGADDSGRVAPTPPIGADWLVIGEPAASPASDPAAAEQELLLDNMLRAIRVSRRSETREGRAFFLQVDEGAAAGIEATIAAVRPRCILALGRGPAGSLLGVDEPLGKLREQVHRRHGLPVVVTFALPYLLRHAADKPRAWADLCRAVAALA